MKASVLCLRMRALMSGLVTTEETSTPEAMSVLVLMTLGSGNLGQILQTFMLRHLCHTCWYKISPSSVSLFLLKLYFVLILVIVLIPLRRWCMVKPTFTTNRSLTNRYINFAPFWFSLVNSSRMVKTTITAIYQYDKLSKLRMCISFISHELQKGI